MLVNQLSEQFFHKPYLDTARFNSRLRTTGGRYLPDERVIEINPKYLNELGMDEVVGIIKHELVHYHLHIEGKGYKHGDVSFKSLLKETGAPRHCQVLPSIKRQNKKVYVYECSNCHCIYKRKKRMDVLKYRCGKCKGKLHDLSNNY